MLNIQDQLIKTILLETYKIPFDKILGNYPFGSITYGTVTEKSDHDFVVIVDMDIDYIQHESEMIDAHIMSVHRYKKMLEDHDIMALEVYFNPMPIKKFETEFKLNLPQLRRKISATVSNSWVKAKKKVTLENEDTYVGIKSCFHAIRIARMGTLIANNEKDIFPQSNVVLWNDILQDANNSNYDWDTLNTIYKPLLNAALSEFRKVATKS